MARLQGVQERNFDPRFVASNPKALERPGDTGGRGRNLRAQDGAVVGGSGGQYWDVRP